MLKSTHHSFEKPLPEGWTAHKAPTGHTYYYNASTKRSTYTRPQEPPEQPLEIDYNATQPEPFTFGPSGPNPNVPNFGHEVNGLRGQGSFTGGKSYQDRSRRHQNDRPKSKKPILNCAPWFLVMTKTKRRFVYNSDTNESFWKFPQDVMLAVIEMERVERERAESGGKQEPKKDTTDSQNEPSVTVVVRPQPSAMEDEDSDEYEEVEVTDDDNETTSEDPSSKRPRTEESVPAGPVEFDEDDIAYQLAQMGEEYGLDAGEYHNPDADGDYEEGEEGLPLTEDDSVALFRDLLDDFKINPYTTFDKLIDDGHIIDDDRYTVLRSMAKRREVFASWSADRIRDLQAKRATEADEKRKRDPRVTYLNYLHDRATLKLYWPEFRRKYKKDDEMKDASFPEKEREKLYREYTARLKMSEQDRRHDLTRLLKEASKTNLIRRNTTFDTIPNELLRDIKLHALPTKVREEVLNSITINLS